MPVKKQIPRQAELFRKLIDGKLDTRFSLLDKKILLLKEYIEKEKMGIRILLKELKKNREDIQNLQQWKKDVGSLDIKTLEEDIYKQFDHLNKKITEDLEKNKELIDKADTEIKILRSDLDATKELDRDIKALNVKDIQRDLEVFKSKINWIEQRIASFDLEPLNQRINELENELRRIKESSPLVIE